MNPLSTLCLRGPCILDPVVDAFACTVFARRAQVYETYVAAAGVCVVDPWLAKEKAKAKKDMLRSHTEKAVGSTEAMGIIFSHLDDIWDRLSTLAYFWNTARGLGLALGRFFSAAWLLLCTCGFTVGTEGPLIEDAGPTYEELRTSQRPKSCAHVKKAMVVRCCAPC